MYPWYVINLDRDTDRWARVKAEADAAHIQLTRWPGVDAKALAPEQRTRYLSVRTEYDILHTLRRCDHRSINTIGPVGCFLAHMNCIKHIRDNHPEGAIVLEDDAAFPYKTQTQAMARELVRGAKTDFVLLHARKYSGVRDSSNPTRAFPLTHLFEGFLAYYISPKGAAYLLSRALPIEGHVDLYAGMMLTHPRAPFQGAVAGDNLVTTYSSKSTISHSFCGHCINGPSSLKKDRGVRIQDEYQIATICLGSILALVVIVVAVYTITHTKGS